MKVNSQTNGFAGGLLRDAGEHLSNTFDGADEQKFIGWQEVEQQPQSFTPIFILAPSESPEQETSCQGE